MHQQGQLQQAENHYREIIALAPRNPDALNMMGLIYQQCGDFDRAVKYARKAVQLNRSPGFLSNLGSAYRGVKKYPEAIEAFTNSLAQKPDLLEAQFNLADTFLECRQYQKAVNAFKKTLNLKPKMVKALEGLSSALLGMGNLPAAISCAKKILAIEPENVVALLNKGVSYQIAGKLDKALAAITAALKTAPEMPEALNSMGNIRGQQGHYNEALSYYEKASTIKSEFVEAKSNLAWMLLQHGQPQKSAKLYRDLVGQNPRDPKIHSDLLFTLNYDPTLSQDQLFAEATLWGKKFSGEIKLVERKSISEKSKPTPSPKRLKIGFLSPDFRNHPVGIFLLPLLSQISKERFETFCYSEISSRNEDDKTTVFKKLADKWYQTSGRTDFEVARQIVSDEIDILIDLAGHSANNRLPVLSYRPAPVQANWLGYVNTTGLPMVDYRITDIEADPPGSESHYCESLIRLPHGFFCYSPPENSPDIQTLPASKMGHVTFGSLNNSVKISEPVIKTWAEILQCLPKSRLIMVSKPLGDEYIRNHFSEIFLKYGVNKERVEMTGYLSMEAYLNLYNQIDIALDPFPHNGHTITCHTLWMGVPVITLRGSRYASRMGASIMTRINLPEFIADSKQEYCDKAVSLALDFDRLAALRQNMRQRLLTSPMCDAKQFAENFQNALLDMWQKRPGTD